MRNDSRAFMYCQLPMVLFMSIFTLGWYLWAGVAPAHQYIEAARALNRSIYGAFGANTAAYLKASPMMLSGTTLTAQIVFPLCAIVFLTTSRDLRQRGLGSLAVLAAAIIGVPHMVGLIAAAAIVPGLSFTSAVEWSGSTWLRSTLVVLPLFVLLASAATSEKWLYRLLLSTAVAGAYGLAGVFFGGMHPTQLIRDLVMNVSHEELAKGLSLSLAMSLAAFVCRQGITHLRSVGPRLRVASVGAVVLFAAGFPLRAHAYSKEGHFAITNAAYQVMRAASAMPSPRGADALLRTPGGCLNAPGLCRERVTQQQWNAFLSEIDWARRLLGSLPNDIPSSPPREPTVAKAECAVSPSQTPMALFRASRRTKSTWVSDDGLSGGFTVTEKFGSLGSTHNHHNADKCVSKVDDPWTPQGMYRDISFRVRADGLGLQGNVLGWHAKNRDDDLNETKLDVNPIIGTPAGPVIAAASKAYERVLGAVFVPFVCAVKWFMGDAEDCAREARRAADKSNPVEAIVAMIPGFNIERDELFIGFWHLMNVRDDWKLSNVWDDHQGMYLMEAGPQMHVGAMDFAAMAAATLAFARIVPEDSSAVRRYEIGNGNDGHEDSGHRTDMFWRRESFGTTPFSPLDNLAFGGYRLFPNDQIKRIGWPLHAIGDATIPMHVAATTSWGHGPYEEWVELHWPELVFDRCVSESCTPTTLAAEQAMQALRVLQIAYRWRAYLAGGHGIRDFITALGKDTLSTVGDRLPAWPWCDLCTVAFDADFESQFFEDLASAFPAAEILPGQSPQEIMRDPVGYYDQFTGNARALVESAMGAKIAFLLWHADQLPQQCIGPQGFGCVQDSDCCGSNVCESGNLCGQ